MDYQQVIARLSQHNVLQPDLDEMIVKLENFHLDDNRVTISSSAAVPAASDACGATPAPRRRRILTPSSASASASGATPPLAPYSYAATMANLFKLTCLSNANLYLSRTMGNIQGY